MACMKTSPMTLNLWLGAILAAASCQPSSADVGESPYEVIIERNLFGLKPPPPIQENLTTNLPPTYAAVRLTGLSDLLGKLVAFLEITEPGPGKTTKRQILKPGDRVDGVEVLQIDLRKSQVKIRNAGIETNLTFEVVTAPAAAQTPPGGRPTQPQPIAGGGGGAVSTATIIGGGGGDRDDGPLVFGGSSSDTAQKPSTVPPQYAPATSTGRGSNPGSGGTPVSIPTRPLRSNPSQSYPPAEASAHAEQMNQQNSAPQGAWPPPPPPLPTR